MVTIAYLANEFPSAVEPYVGEEIRELRTRGVRVVSGSVRKTHRLRGTEQPDIVLQIMKGRAFPGAVWLGLRHWKRVVPLIARVMFRGDERPWTRVKTLLHTFLGACYAALLGRYKVDHIHVHHGYFGSWIAMTAARLLGVEFSMTLHGSDLLLHRAFLDAKLEECSFCLTISEYNRNYLLQNYPNVEPQKIVTARLGVEVPNHEVSRAKPKSNSEPLSLLAVGRLHPVKNHGFLVQACARLHALNVPFECFIAGQGPERRRLRSLIAKSDLDEQITLLGHVPPTQMDSLYDRADVVVLTSLSEGIPLVLMEAMARRRIVLAPLITGIPELVVRGKTGFLYEAGSQDDFVERLLLINSLMRIRENQSQHRSHAHSRPNILDWVRHGAQVQVRHNFNRKTNVEAFADLFLQRIRPKNQGVADENLVLQQV